MSSGEEGDSTQPDHDGTSTLQLSDELKEEPTHGGMGGEEESQVEADPHDDSLNAYHNIIERIDHPKGFPNTLLHGSGYHKIKSSEEEGYDRPSTADTHQSVGLSSHDGGDFAGYVNDKAATASPMGSVSGDDTPSVQGSLISSTASIAQNNDTLKPRDTRPSFRPFDRRFSSQMSITPLMTPRPSSPAFLQSHSRKPSLSGSIGGEVNIDGEEAFAPWDVVRWTKLKKITPILFSEVGMRQHGQPTCINVFSSIVVGTSKGLLLVFDYHQVLLKVIGLGTKAIECGPITSIAISADYTTIAGGHGKGDIFTWELARPTKPFLHVQHVPLAQNEDRKMDGHVEGASVLHLGFLGTRHTALVSADDKGMAFSHLGGRSLVGRIVKTTRILGRYPFDIATSSRPRKPSAVMAFGPLPLGNNVQVTDTMGLVAMLTPYLLVIVSTTPIAQTQYKTPITKEVAHDTALSGCLAWFPATKLKTPEVDKIHDKEPAKTVVNARLAYSWSNILTVLEVSIAEPTEPDQLNKAPALKFKIRHKWKCDEAIVAIQWLGRQVLGVLTISQRLLILEEPDMRLTEKFDLLRKEIYHQDLFSRQLRSLVGRVDAEASTYTAIADAYYNSVKTYKGRIFLLSTTEVSVGALSSWADRLLALMEVGDFIAAIRLATDYYSGEIDMITVGLPEDNSLRHSLVQAKLLDMILASLRYAFGLTTNSIPIGDPEQLQQLASVCFVACTSMDNLEFLFGVVYDSFEDGSAENIFLELLEPYILADNVKAMPPGVVKALVSHFTSLGLENRLEDMICHLDPLTMDIDQITGLCKQNGLYDALIHVWNRALKDYVTPLIELFSLLLSPNSSDNALQRDSAGALKIFPYLSFILTGREYPSGNDLTESEANNAKATLYYFLFLGRPISWPRGTNKPFLTQGRDETREPSFPYLRLILNYDAASFMSLLNEAFEDSFLNGTQLDPTSNGSTYEESEDQVFGRSVNRQYIVSILLEIMVPSDFDQKDIIYLDMFIARNLPKYPQYLLLPGNSLQQVLLGLCNYPSDDIADDCQLSVEYLLSVYRPPTILDMVDIFNKARFYRVLKTIYRSENDYARLLQTYFEDPVSDISTFDCIAECLHPENNISGKQREDVINVITKHKQDLLLNDTVRTAETINMYAPQLHQDILSSIDYIPAQQYIYLKTLLEPTSEKNTRLGTKPFKTTNREHMLELYVKHMCTYDPDHVSDYIETLQTGDLNLSSVLPALEESGAIDAVVHLMSREGRIREAMDKLLAHLLTLEVTLTGLLESTLSQENEDDDEDRTEANLLGNPIKETLVALQKYSLVGVWLCKGQMHNAMAKASQAKQTRPQENMQESLTFEELLWLDLVDSVVRIAKNISNILQDVPTKTVVRSRTSSIYSSFPQTPMSRTFSFSSRDVREHDVDYSRIILSMRKYVQDIFTSLLSATTSPSSSSKPIISFLRVFQAFLRRAAISSPSLVDLRNVLAGIFDAYMYEQQLLSLSLQLLDKDLYHHVKDIADARQKGWRPQGQSCQLCERKVWGAGAFHDIFAAWTKRQEALQEAQKLANEELDDAEGEIRNKGKAPVAISSSTQGQTSTEEEDVIGTKADEDGEQDFGPLYVFSCKHMFHKLCLVKAYEEEDRKTGRNHSSGGEDWKCVLCSLH